MNLNELKQEAIAKGAKYQKLLAQGNELSSVELKEAGILSGELKALKEKIEVYADSEEIKSWINSPKSPFNPHPTKTDEHVEVDPKKINSNIKGLSDAQLNAVCSDGYKEAFNEYVRVGRDRMSPTNYKTLQEGADINGGFLVPEQIQMELIQKRQGLAGVSSRVRRLQTGRDNLVVPRSNYTTDNYFTSPVRMTKTGEIPAAATTADITDPTFGQTRIDIYTFMANGTITKDLLEDSMFDVQEFVGSKFAEAVTQQVEGYIISGTGAGQPAGILAAPGSTIGNQPQPSIVPLGITASGFSPDGIIKLAYALEPQYDQNACFVLNKTNTGAGLQLMKDTSGRYLFSAGGYGDAGFATARPRSLVGYDYIYSNQMPDGFNASISSAVADAYPIIFGDLSGYYLVERSALSVMVLDQPLATLNQVQLVGRFRFGGATVEDWKIKVGKVSNS